MRFLVVGAAAVAALSVVQFMSGETLVNQIEIPGLSRNSALDLGARQGLARPSGTATHPIEFAALLSMVVPIAIMDAKGRDHLRVRHFLPVALLVLGVALSLSRTAILCVGLALVLIFPALPKAWRWGGVVAAVILAGVLYVTVPGMVGTLRGLFLGIADDPSVLSRTDAYAVAAEFLARAPVIGRGLGTFLPKYWIVDNMYVQLVVEIGLLGIAAILALFLTAIFCAWRARRLFPPGRDRDLATGLMASLAAGATSFAFFDALSFPQAAFCMFLLMGTAGALWRIAREQATVHGPAADNRPPSISESVGLATEPGPSNLTYASPHPQLEEESASHE
jgi:O-antigen ligase